MLACVPALVIGYLLHLIPPRYSTMTNCEGVPLFTESHAGLCTCPRDWVPASPHPSQVRYVSTMTNCKGVPLFTESHAGLCTCPRDWVPASPHPSQVQYHDILYKGTYSHRIHVMYQK
jgi:hypothetical protein